MRRISVGRAGYARDVANGTTPSSFAQSSSVGIVRLRAGEWEQLSVGVTAPGRAGIGEQSPPRAGEPGAPVYDRLVPQRRRDEHKPRHSLRVRRRERSRGAAAPALPHQNEPTITTDAVGKAENERDCVGVGQRGGRRASVAVEVGQGDTIARLSESLGHVVPLGDDLWRRRHAVQREDGLWEVAPAVSRSALNGASHAARGWAAGGGTRRRAGSRTGPCIGPITLTSTRPKGVDIFVDMNEAFEPVDALSRRGAYTATIAKAMSSQVPRTTKLRTIRPPSFMHTLSLIQKEKMNRFTGADLLNVRALFKGPAIALPLSTHFELR